MQRTIDLVIVQGQGLLSDAVVDYKRSMNACGRAVWHAGEVRRNTPPAMPSHTAPTATDEFAPSATKPDGSPDNAAEAQDTEAGDAAGNSDATSAHGATAASGRPAAAPASSDSNAAEGVGSSAGAGDYYYGSAGASFMAGAASSGSSSSSDDSTVGVQADVGGAEPASLEGFIGLCTEAYNVTDREMYGSAAAGAAVEAPQGTTAVDASQWGSGHVVLAVGPERGWTDEELGMLQRQGFVVAGMGGRVLSSTTAVVSAVSIVQEALR